MMDFEGKYKRVSDMFSRSQFYFFILFDGVVTS